MVENKYDKEFAVGVVTAGSVLGPIIPPSIALVLFATLANTSVVGLYRAGIPAGLILSVGFIAVAYFRSRKRGYHGISRAEALGEKVTLKAIFMVFLDSIWAILAPVIILGSMFSGICTPTESAVVAVLYSIVISIWVYKSMKIKDLPKCFLGSAISAAKVLFIVAGAQVFSWIITFERIPQKILNAVLDSGISNGMIVAIMIITWLLMGTVLNNSTIYLLTVPIFMPLALDIGFDLVHFGIVCSVAICVGMLTPPFGNCLFAGMNIGNMTMGAVTKQIIPYIIVMIAVLILITAIPQLVMFIV